METANRKPCQWQPCTEEATKHVRFGFRTFGERDFPEGMTQPYTVMHRDLCEKHLAKAKLEYLDVMEFELGNCRSCRG